MQLREFLAKQREFIAVTSLTATGALLRVINLGKADLWRDEAFSARAAQRGFTDLIKTLANDTAPPLHTIVIHFWMNVFGESEFSIRFPSLIFGVLLLPIIYKLALIVTNSRRISIAALTLAVVNPVLIFYSQEARSYSLLAFLSTLTLYLSIKIAKQKVISNFDFIALTIATLAGFYTHNLFVFLAFPCFLIALEPKFRQLRKPDNYTIKLFASYVMSFGLFLPWFFILLKQMTKVKDEGFWLTFDPLQRPVEVTVNSFNGVVHYFNNELGMDLIKVISVLGVVVFLLGTVWLIRNFERTTKQMRLVLFWLGFVMAVSWAYSYFSTPVMYIRYMVFVVPVVLIIATLGLNFRRKAPLYLTIAVLIILSIAQLGLHIIYLKEIENTKEDMSFLVEDLAYVPGDLILHPHAYTHHAYNFYADNQNFIYNPKRDLPYFEGLALIDEEAYYPEDTIYADRVWVIYLWNADEELTKELEKNYYLYSKSSYKGNLYLEQWQTKN